MLNFLVQQIQASLVTIKLKLMTDKIIIAIDGFASTGKSTLAKRLA